MREELFGKPFGMYDFAPVGLALTALGVLFPSFGHRALQAARAGRGLLEGLSSLRRSATRRPAPPAGGGAGTVPDRRGVAAAGLKLNKKLFTVL